MTRAVEVDAVRGFALFGICVVNVPFLAQPIAAAMAPANGLDLAARMVVQMFFEGKFFVIFSFVFGWGFTVQLESAARAGVSGTRRFARRLAGLLAIGAAHASFVFIGDILILYALLGLPLLALRDATPRCLLIIASVSVALGALVLMAMALSLDQLMPSQITGAAPGYRGNFIDALNQRVREWPDAFAFIVLFNGPLAFAAFCAGLAAARVGFFTPGNASYLRVRRNLPLLAGISLPLNALYAVSATGALGAGMVAAAGFAALAIAGPMLGLVYLVAVIELTRRGSLQTATVASGRLSLSIYVLEGVIAGLIFNGYGFGLYGSVGAVGCLGIAIAIYVTAHAVAKIWLTWFDHGPLEWLLRWITLGNRPVAGG
jgi:uncharacterized protein